MSSQSRLKKLTTFNKTQTMEAGDREQSFNLTVLNFTAGSVDNLLTKQNILRHTLFWTCILVFVCVAVFVVGIISNLVIICVLLIKTQIKTATELFTLNLAIADIFVAIFCVLPTLLSSIFVPWLLGSVMCQPVAFVQGVSVFASAYSLAAISFDRFLVIIFPMKWPRGLTMFQARVIVVCIWTSAIAVIFPWLIVFRATRSGRRNEEFCVEDWPYSMDSELFFLIGNLLMCYVLPLSMISISNGIICLQVERRRVPEGSASPAAIKSIHRKTRQGVIRILSVLTFPFLISWLPLYLIFLIRKFGGPMTEFMEKVISIAIPLAQCLAASCCCSNPLLFFFFNQKFKDSFRSLITCSGCLCLQSSVISFTTCCSDCFLVRPPQDSSQRRPGRMIPMGPVDNV